jgi:hypothetical protein
MDKLDQRRAQRRKPEHRAAISPYHRDLRTACRPVGNGLIFLIRYCPDCMKGTVIDLVRELPSSMPDARELQVKQQRPWRMECSEVTS